ncbi:MAG: flagellar biosynthesis protein FlhB [Fibrobacterota bacterium]
MADQEEKTEAPTGRRRGEARQKGQVAKSMELNSVAILLAGLIALYIYRWELYDGITQMMIKVIRESTCTPITINNVYHYTFVGCIWFAKLLGPILLILVVVGVAVNILQIGWLLTTEPIMPNLSKLNPLSGLKNMLSMNKLFDVTREVLKLIVIVVVAYITLKKEIPLMLALSAQSAGGILEVLFGTIFKVGIRIALALLVLAIIDYIYQRYKQEKQMRMTKQEVKDERRQTEGDPLVKGKIRSLQVEMAMRRMMSDVPKATVVLTNPTFIAIALKYEMGVDKAPMVVAKGKRKNAERIREIAKEHGIPIVEDKPLARAMYDVIEIGTEIPGEYFTPIAEILAYVYKLKEKVA